MTTLTLKKTLIISIFLLQTTFSFGQKFMIKNNDTLPYKVETEIRDGDTMYLHTCWSFEIVNAQIINQTDNQCKRQGLWTITDSLGNYRTGNYQDNNEVGIWKRFDKSGKLLTETENVSFGKDTYTVKEIDYSSGQPVTIIDKPFLSFYIKNLAAIMGLLFVAFFGRIFINSSIYNSENGTDFSPFYFHFGQLVTKNFVHSLCCTFTCWFSTYKPENKRLVIISNTMSVIALIIFFGIIMVLAITGEI